MLLTPDLVRNVLAALGAVLQDRGLEYRLVVIGGSALLLAGDGVRPSADLDVLALAEDGPLRPAPPTLPPALHEAARDIAPDFELAPDWLNTGATGVIDQGRLPEGFWDRLTWTTYGGLEVGIPARQDRVFLKLDAAADEGLGSQHSLDLYGMQATLSEMRAVAGPLLDGPRAPDVRAFLAAAEELSWP